MKRVGILGIQHESNTFLPGLTKLHHFEECTYLRGEQIRRHYRDAHHEAAGFFEGLDAAAIEAVPLFAAFAMPGGPVEDATLENLWETAKEALHQAGPLDGLLVMPHGAAVNESRTDMDGWWLTELRKAAGAETPIIAVIDPHANLTPDMVGACNAIIAYRENPHVDQRVRGREAAGLMARTLGGQVQPVVAGGFAPLAVNIERQLTTSEPLLSLNRELNRIRAISGVLSASFIMGYVYADVPEMGGSFVVVTDDDLPLAKRLSWELINWLEIHRERFRGEMIAPEDALRLADKLPKPVALLDMGDNVGGGAPADSTVLAALCHAREDGNRTFVSLFDPESVRRAEAAGPGSTISLEMGGWHTASPSPPLKARVKVEKICDGRFREEKPRHGGLSEFDMGRVAIVSTDSGLTVMLTSRPAFPSSANQMLAFGLIPLSFDRIILKGVHSPVAGYTEYCPSMIRVNTPGVTTADIKSLNYRNRRKPLFPFEELTAYTPAPNYDSE